MKRLADCRRIAEDAARLACFDKAAGELDVAESTGQVVVIDQAQAREVRRQAFGFHVPSLNIFSRTGPKTGEGVDQVTLVLAGAYRDAQGKWVFRAEDGAVWRQTDDFDFGDDPHKGSTLLIKSGAIGSYFCKIDHQAAVRCARVS